MQKKEAVSEGLAQSFVSEGESMATSDHRCDDAHPMGKWGLPRPMLKFDNGVRAIRLVNECSSGLAPDGSACQPAAIEFTMQTYKD